jgi:RND family efflux transporter MFP subunit
MKKILITLLVPVVAGVVLFTCTRQEEQAAANEVPLADESAIAVRTTPVEQVDFAKPIVSSGMITTGTEARLSFKVGGIVAKVLVEEGASVTKGQLLASLNLTELDAQVSQAKNNVDKLKRDWERVQKLYADSAATLEQLQNTETAYAVATEGYRIATFNRQYASIHATSSGRVLRKLINEGELVTAGSPAFLLNAASENDWIVKIGLPDVDWVRIRLGDAADITTDAHGSQVMAGTVSLIGEGADPLSGLYPVEIRLNAKGQRLASGLIAKVQVTPSQKERLQRIPIEAVVEGRGMDAFVFVSGADGKTVKKIPVKLAYLAPEEALVRTGLEGVSEVITGGSAFLTPFSSIKVVQ